MKAEHLEILVEEPSMEAFLRQLLPGLLGEKATFNVYPYQCKDDLLGKLHARLQGYASWLPENWRVVVVIDRDDDDCEELKQRMEHAASSAGLRTRNAGAAQTWQVANRIAIEELEAWYFGDWVAVRNMYLKVPATIPQKEPYRNPDEIQGGTWEAFERVLQKAGYFKTGLRKTEVARALGKCMDPAQNRSRSFAVFRDTVLEAVA
jgi:hypothetical protein